MLRFDPPENATHAEKQPSEGWISCGWTMLDKWREGKGYRELGRLFGTSAGNVCTWKQGRVPAKPYLEKLESIADIPPIAWQWWICVDPSKSAASSDESPPSSGSRSVEGVKLGSTLDELRASVERLTAILAKSKLSPAQVATLEGKRISALIAVSKLEQTGKLEDHPEFAQFVRDTIDAVKETFTAYGVTQPDALRMMSSIMRRKGAERNAGKRAA
jgi:hypothetical protein